ncbi:putative membrane protein [Saccharothrix espanaensis DSM 44229]|uniref:Putative membrane protein n=1 Tax=Saccharothrix espanaensis (strain ATCC 51144 / DSM 44229 / JCM 9112 / NBRC 15066 / NRRL 15764) TaxID=1179773 RepID=K0KAJ2_SACES|nr:putative membrane protein [Saccharothrix espanaensis DSM 44229]
MTSPERPPGAQRPPTQRVVVTSPRTRAPRAPRPYPASREIDEQSDLGAVYMRSLIRTQRRLGLLLCAVVCGSVAGLPLVFTLVPSVAAQRLFGLPLPWLLLGGLVFPVFVAAGWFYVRQAERGEREFAELVERS